MSNKRLGFHNICKLNKTVVYYAKIPKLLNFFLYVQKYVVVWYIPFWTFLVLVLFSMVSPTAVDLAPTY